MTNLGERRGRAGPAQAPGARRRAQTGQERRIFGRHEVEGVRGTFLFSTDAKVVNLSLDGLAVETSSYLQVGHEYSLRLEHASRPMHVRGRVAWCSLVRTSRDRRGDVAPVYRAGLHFEKILGEEATDLYRFIERSAVVRLEGRVYGRVRIQPPESANVQHETRFELRRISQSGMGIESDFAPAVDAMVHIEMRLNRKKFVGSGRLVHMQQLEEKETGVPRVLIGIEFIDLEERFRGVLEGFIRMLLD